MKSKWIAVLVGVLGLFGAAAPDVQAEPYFAVLSGQKCMACHTNMTGGGKRTTVGNAFGQMNLSARRPSSFWNGTVSDYLAIGGNLRASATATDTPNQDNTFEFDVDEARLFFEFPLLANRLTLYLDQQFAPSTNNREAFALLRFPESSAYIKAGKFYLPYGWRLEDDTEFVRLATGINMENPDNGIEAGIEFGAASLRLAVTNGTAGGGEVDTGKQFSLQGTWVKNRWQLGLNANFNDAEGAERSVYGGFAGIRTGPVTWLGEIDLIEDDGLGPSGRTQIASFLEANWRIRQGHLLKVTYGGFDPDEDLDEDERNRYSIVYEYFPMAFTHLRIGIRSNDGIPQNDAQNAETAFVQLHAYF